jgi:hypothetical protein
MRAGADRKRDNVFGTFAPAGTEVESAAFSPDGSYVAASYKGTVCVWDRSTGACRNWPPPKSVPANAVVHSLAFSPDPKTLRLAWGNDNGNLLEVDPARDGRAPRVYKEEWLVNSLAYANHGTRIVAGGSAPDPGHDGQKVAALNILDAATLQPIGPPYPKLYADPDGLSWIVRSIAISPDDQYVALGVGATGKGAVVVIDLKSGSMVAKFSGFNEVVSGVVFFTPTQVLATSWDGTVKEITFNGLGSDSPVTKARRLDIVMGEVAHCVAVSPKRAIAAWGIARRAMLYDPGDSTSPQKRIPFPACLTKAISVNDARRVLAVEKNGDVLQASGEVHP